MIKKEFNTPILFLIFNRIETTTQVFKAIRDLKPPKLYIAADGPRNNICGESEKVKEVRDYVTKNIDWKCDVDTLFRQENLGCKMAVSKAISWFFSNEEKGIILEDDCLPNSSFFYYCQDLLAKYENDMRIWHIGGVSTLAEQDIKISESYYFSKFNHIWGWATWSNRWSNYDVNINNLENFLQRDCLSSVTSNNLLKKFWINNFFKVSKNQIDTWDYQWYFTTWLNNGLSIIPKKNLVTNIGFGPNATHTSSEESKLSKMKSEELNFPLKHPSLLYPNHYLDEINAKYLFDLSLFKYYLSMIKSSIKKMFIKNS